MMHEKNLNNKVTLYGRIDSEFKFTYEVFGEKYYEVKVKVERLSGKFDIIPCILSESMIDVSKDMIGTYVKIKGLYRSFNLHIENKHKLQLYVYVNEIEFISSLSNENTNNIELRGYIVKHPIYRKTPLGKDIADILLAVNRPYGKSDYIPCICWGRVAKYASLMEIGDELHITGRIQSREYIKKLSDTECEKRTAYEVSIDKFYGIITLDVK